MPAPKALLQSTPKLRKTSTATEHATSSSQLDPAASTDDVSLGPLTGLPDSAISFTSEDGLTAFLGDVDLEKIVELLMWMTQDFQPKFHVDDIRYAAIEAIIKCADSTTGNALGLLYTKSITKLTKLVDIMMQHKDGSPKDANATLRFMRRSAIICEELLASSSDNATERVDKNGQTIQIDGLDEEKVASCY